MSDSDDSSNHILGILDPYPIRILLCKKTHSLVSTLKLIQEHQNLKDRIEILEENIKIGDQPKIFRYFEIEGKGRVYTFLLHQRGTVSNRVVGKIFDLVGYKRVPVITYIHPYAIPLINKISALENFFPILFHNTPELEEYIKGNVVFYQSNEILYYLVQKQKYVKERVTSRTTFQENSKAKEERFQKKRNENRSPSNNGEYSNGERSNGEDRSRRPPGRKNRKSNGRGPRKSPVNKGSQKRTPSPQKSESGWVLPRSNNTPPEQEYHQPIPVQHNAWNNHHPQQQNQQSPNQTLQQMLQGQVQQPVVNNNNQVATLFQGFPIQQLQQNPIQQIPLQQQVQQNPMQQGGGIQMNPQMATALMQLLQQNMTQNIVK